MSYPELQAAERRRLRLAIDSEVRRRAAAPGGPYCRGCWMPLDDLTPGCSLCSDRHRRRAQRAERGAHAAESQHLLAIVKARFDWSYMERARANAGRYAAAREAEGRS